MRFENSNRLAGLNEERFVIIEFLQRMNDGVITIPVPGGFAGSAINHQIARTLADFFVEIIHQHAHRGFLLPSLAGERGTTRRTNWSVGGSFCVNRHSKMVLLNEAF